MLIIILCAIRLRCESCAPFDMPVVPPVYGARYILTFRFVYRVRGLLRVSLHS